MMFNSFPAFPQYVHVASSINGCSLVRVRILKYTRQDALLVPSSFLQRQCLRSQVDGSIFVHLVLVRATEKTVSTTWTLRLFCCSSSGRGALRYHRPLGSEGNASQLQLPDGKVIKTKSRKSKKTMSSGASLRHPPCRWRVKSGGTPSGPFRGHSPEQR
jgi:hypothetical protein